MTSRLGRALRFVPPGIPIVLVALGLSGILTLAGTQPAQAQKGGGTTDPSVGRPISLVHFGGSSPTIQLVRENGSGAVTVNGSKDLQASWPRWSPDGSMLGGYYKDLRNSAGEVVDTGLMVMTAGGSNERVAISESEFGERNLARPGVLASRWLYPRKEYPAAWLGSDSLIFTAYVEYDPSFFGESDAGYAARGPRLFVVDSDGGITPLTETRPRAPYTGSYHDFAPDWSPALDKVVFVSTRSGYHELYAINPDGTGLVQITDFRGGPAPGSPLTFNQPRWSPDGTRVAVRVLGGSGNYHLWILDVDLSKPAPGEGPDGRVTGIDPFKTQTGADKEMPSWSPAGDYLLFRRVINSRSPDFQIVAADAETGAETVLIGTKQGLGFPDRKPVR